VERIEHTLGVGFCHWIGDLVERRLDDPDDLVRAEVASGLANEQIRVIPVLVRGASMPSSHELPNDLQGLPRRNAFELSDIRFRHDADVLIQRIKRFETPPPSPNPPEKNKSAYRKTAQGVLVLSLLIGIVGYSINAIRAAMTQSPASTMTLAATSTNKPVSTVTSTLTPYPTPSPHILMMDQYYKHINNAGNSDELKKAWDLLTAKLQCHLYEDCKFVHYKEWWWKWKVQYKLYDCGSLIIQTELRYYRRDSGTNATLTAPAYVKYWLVDDRGQLKIDSGLVTNKPDAECSQTASSQ